MPNCVIDGCIARVDDEGMKCRIHQLEKTDEPDVKVQYVGADFCQHAYGTFTKGTIAYIPSSEADKLKGDKNWVVG